MLDFESFSRAAHTVRARIGTRQPEVLLILGSGLGSLADMAENAVSIPYGEIDGFPVSTAPTHRGRLVCGNMEGKCVLFMQGRVHAYEGYSMQQIAFPIFVAALLGVKCLIVTNAAGAIRPDIEVGSLMLISDHINLRQESPLVGPPLTELGPRFFDMTDTYTKSYRMLAHSLGFPLQEGVYVYTRGPQFETPAEIAAFSRLGGDAVGMSSVPEVIAGRKCGMGILGVSLICNLAAGVSNAPQDEADVFQASEQAKPVFIRFIRAFLKQVNSAERK